MKTTKTEPDRRYRLMIILRRSDRPNYFTWNCPFCTYPVNELMNAEVGAMSDVIDMQNIKNFGIGVRCGGRFEGRACGTWYYFNLGSNSRV